MSPTHLTWHPSGGIVGSPDHTAQYFLLILIARRSQRQGQTKKAANPCEVRSDQFCCKGFLFICSEYKKVLPGAAPD